jgi:Rod binding domain-containing protein
MTSCDLSVAAPAQTTATDAASAATALQRHAKLADAAQKFEGMMMQELLKPMQEGKGSWDGEDDKDRDASMDNFSSYGVEALANALAKTGGLGIAKQVLRQIGNIDEKGGKK